MVYYLRKKSSKKPKRKMARKPKTTAKGVSQVVARYVNNVIHKNVENKVVNYKDQLLFSDYNSYLDLQVQPLFPCSTVLQIPQGNFQGQRNGNTIRTRKLTLKYTLFPVQQIPNEQNDQPKPQEVLIWIGYLKNNRQQEPGVGEFISLFQQGDTSVQPVGNLWDITSDINKDLFTVVKSFRHKIGNAIYTDYTGIKPWNYYSNNDYKINVTRSVDLTKHINKVLKFDDDSLVSDTGLYMWMESVNCDSTIDQFTTKVGIYYNLKYEYEDA